MLGTVINVAAVVAGSALGVSVGSRLPERIRETVLHGLGLLTLLVGLQMALKTENILIVMGAVLTGGILGEVFRIHDRLERLGVFLQMKLAVGSAQSFGQGFVMSSLVFCIGPMAILGSIQDGLTGDYSLLSIKSILDGFASIAFAAGMGWGVSLAAVTVLIYQGSLTLFAGSFSELLTPPMITEMTATGGLIILGIAFRLLQLMDLRLANFLPALAIAPFIVSIIPLVRGLF